MIIMLMCEQDGMNIWNIVGQHLLAEIRTYVNSQAQVASFKKSSGAKSFIVGIGGLADFTLTPYDRDALGGTCT